LNSVTTGSEPITSPVHGPSIGPHASNEIRPSELLTVSLTMSGPFARPATPSVCHSASACTSAKGSCVSASPTVNLKGNDPNVQGIGTTSHGLSESAA